MREYYTEIAATAVGLFTTLSAYILGKRKNNAEIDVMVSGNWKDFAHELKERIESLEIRIDLLETENSRLRKRELQLMAIIEDYNS